MSVPSMCFLLKIEITLLLRNINEKHIFIQTAPYRLYRIPCTYCSSVHKNRYDHQKHQKPTSLKIADEKGNSKKNQLKMKREFLNTLYSSSYTGAGALCSTSVDLVFVILSVLKVVDWTGWLIYFRKKNLFWELLIITFVFYILVYQKV